MRTTDIQILYKQAYWSQTNQNYKHGFFYNTETKQVGYKYFPLEKQKGYISVFTFVQFFFSIILMF